MGILQLSGSDCATSAHTNLSVSVIGSQSCFLYINSYLHTSQNMLICLCTSTVRFMPLNHEAIFTARHSKWLPNDGIGAAPGDPFTWIQVSILTPGCYSVSMGYVSMRSRCGGLHVNGSFVCYTFGLVVVLAKPTIASILQKRGRRACGGPGVACCVICTLVCLEIKWNILLARNVSHCIVRKKCREKMQSSGRG